MVVAAPSHPRQSFASGEQARNEKGPVSGAFTLGDHLPAAWAVIVLFRGGRRGLVWKVRRRLSKVKTPPTRVSGMEPHKFPRSSEPLLRLPQRLLNSR
jgi:hypothetical protein